MGFCRSRYFMLVICFLQFVAVIQRQVFDFLGYLWIPILLNFFQIIFVIFGSFGAFQYRPKYIITYVLWNLIWLGWNVFLICLYLDVGILNHKENKVLKLDPESDSWWINGPGCKIVLDPENNAIRGGCLVEYEHVEIFQAGLQSCFAVLGIVSGLCLSKMFLEEDDSFNYTGGGNPQHLSIQPVYVNTDSISCSSAPILHTNLTSNSTKGGSARALTTSRDKRLSDDFVSVGKNPSFGSQVVLADKYILRDTDSPKGKDNRRTIKAEYIPCPREMSTSSDNVSPRQTFGIITRLSRSYTNVLEK